MTHQEAEIFQLMARGRALRSRAFVDAINWMVRGVKGVFGSAAAPAPKPRRTAGC